MPIQEGFDAVRGALFGDRSPVGECSRCKRPLIIDSLEGTAQPHHDFVFHLKDREPGDISQPWGILMGCSEGLFSWEAKLCNYCLHHLRDWLQGY